MRIVLLFAFALSMISCQKSKVPWHTISLTQLEGEQVNLGNNSLKGTVLFFLSPECPLCENYSLNINETWNGPIGKEMKIYGIFPGTYYSESKIKAYKIKYEIDIPFLMDPDYSLTHSLNATVTPEVFVFNDSHELLYQGAIDNWMVSLGKKRTVVTEHYLNDALAALDSNTFPKVRKTKPVGCYIE